MNVSLATEAARAGKLYPSVIFHGGSAELRRATAAVLARTLLCARPADERPCGSCEHCRRIDPAGESSGELFHPDFQVLERDLKTATSVDATKAFLRGAQVSPFEARGQVFVVANAETLSGEAANALLKTLEEPATRSPRNFFLLAPSRLDLLPTLRSRSLALFLGAGERPAGEDVSRLAAELNAALRAYWDRGESHQLFAAAAALKGSGDFRDAASRVHWERAAAVALECAAGLAAGPARRSVLNLAHELLEAQPLRARGIPVDRILEGAVHRSVGR